MDKVSHDADDFDRCWAPAKYNDYVVATARALARCVLRLRVQDLDLGERAGARLAPSTFRTCCRKKFTQLYMRDSRSNSLDPSLTACMIMIILTE